MVISIGATGSAHSTGSSNIHGPVLAYARRNGATFALSQLLKIPADQATFCRLATFVKPEQEVLMFRFKHTALASLTGLAFLVTLPGCATPQPYVLPTSAMNVESGSGSMHFMAPADGTVYVFEPATQHLAWSGQVKRNEVVDVDPAKVQVLVSGRVAATGVLQPNALNQVFFNPTPPPEPQPVQASNAQRPQPPYNGSAYNNGVILTPNVSVQPSANNAAPGSVEVQPGLRVSPATVPTTQP